MNVWEKLKVLSTIISVLIIPIIIGIVGNSYTTAVKEREIQGKFVELAVNILNQIPTKDSKNLREWAIQIIDEYSGVKLSDSTKTDLIEQISLTKRIINIRGKVLGNGMPVPKAIVSIVSLGIYTLTNSLGEFELKIQDVPANKITLSVSKTGYQNYLSDFILGFADFVHIVVEMKKQD